MIREIQTEKFIVRIHGEVKEENLKNACKKYCEKVDLAKERKSKND